MELSDFLFVSHLKYTAELFAIQECPQEKIAAILQVMIWEMEKEDSWKAQDISEASRRVAAFFDVNHKKVIMPILFASIMGKKHGLPLFDSVELLGKDRTRVRWLQSMDFVGALSTKKVEALKKAWEKGESFSL